MSKLISVKNLTRNYGDFCAVDNISFDLETGHILGFLGPNGAGKSSTMQMLAGTLSPTYGEISINGIDLLENPKQAKASLGYLPENPPLYKEMTILEYLRFCARLHLVSAKELNTKCDSAIERCGLGDVRHRIIKNLSKGYQQRVGIAQAILHSPPVIILDEPTVGLDPIQILEIRSLIKTLSESHGVLLCTHILPEVQAVCNRVQIMNKGKLVYNASMNELNNQNKSQFEISLSKENSYIELIKHEAFTEIEQLSSTRYIVDSHLSAEDLTAYIIKQQWGLTHFSKRQTSLEQIFVDLTNKDMTNQDTTTQNTTMTS